MRVYWLVQTQVQNCVPLGVTEHSQVSLTVQAYYTKGCTHQYAAQVDTYTYATRVSLHRVDRALEDSFTWCLLIRYVKRLL